MYPFRVIFVVYGTAKMHFVYPPLFSEMQAYFRRLPWAIIEQICMFMAYARQNANISQKDFPTIVNRTSLFPILGFFLVVYYYSNFDRTNCLLMTHRKEALIARRWVTPQTQ